MDDLRVPNACEQLPFRVGRDLCTAARCDAKTPRSRCDFCAGALLAPKKTRSGSCPLSSQWGCAQGCRSESPSPDVGNLFPTTSPTYCPSRALRTAVRQDGTASQDCAMATTACRLAMNDCAMATTACRLAIQDCAMATTACQVPCQHGANKTCQARALLFRFLQPRATPDCQRTQRLPPRAKNFQEE
jgi:hypothetical protein